MGRLWVSVFVMYAAIVPRGATDRVATRCSQRVPC